ncbi:hypothetical protein LTR85_007399 [Meristemomyces frigidus]|nr:hypothetical protein LTR85_007399 [Meristemomyces frigidus]
MSVLAMPPSTAAKKPDLTKSPSSSDSYRTEQQPRTRQVRVETPTRPHSTSREGDRENSTSKSPLPRPRKLSGSKSGMLLGVRHYHDVTPPEAESISSKTSMIRHGDHYFRTFAPDAGYSKEYTPARSTNTSQKPSLASMRPLPVPVQLPFTNVRSQEAPQASKRKRSSIFKAFRKSALTDSTYEAPYSGIVGTSPPSRPTPGIFIISPQTPQQVRPSRRMSSSLSDGPLPSYFEQPQHSDRSDDTSSTSLVSPLSTGGKPARRSMHSRSSTEDVSPFSRPRSRPRLRHRATLANMDEDADTPVVLPSGPPVPAVHTLAAFSPQTTYMSGNGKEYNKTPLTGPGASSWLPSEMRRVPTPPDPEKQPPAAAGGKKRSGFRQFLHDLRSTTPEPVTTSSEASTVDTDDTPGTGPACDKRPYGLVTKGSMATLLQMASRPQLNKLKRKVSQATVSTARYTPPLSAESSLEVTEFHQTPYGQRYGNTRRAEMNQIRTFVEDALNEDGDEDLQLGFELDVPDHLPNSPLCPLNPRHKSGGKAICPLHGRKKQTERGPTTVIKAATRAATKVAGKVASKPKPHIVYEGKVESWVDTAHRRGSAEGAAAKKRRTSQSSDGTWYS